MKRILLFLIFLLPNLLAFAGSDLGGEISYQRLTKYNYRVTYRHYRDCQGTPAGSTFNLNVASPGCNPGRTVTLNLVSRKLAKPYGAATPLTCSGLALPNYEIITYSGLVNFTAADYRCRNWTLGIASTDHTQAENIAAGSDSANYYTEAHLKLDFYQANNSPVFDTLNAPLMYVNFQTDYTLSIAAKDPDGDSLVYSLVAPLTAPGIPVQYNSLKSSYAGLSGLIINTNSKPPYSYPFFPQVAQVTGAPGFLFSPTFPIVSVKIDWNGQPTIPAPNAPIQPYIWAANAYFEFDKNKGRLKFNPYFYEQNPQNISKKNRYLVSILVEEYRKINGVAVKMGSVRRETLIQVFNKNFNLVPGNAPVSGNQPSNVRVSSNKGFINVLNETAFTAFPNPFREELTFNLNLQSKAESIVIYNLLGKTVSEIPLKMVGLGEQKVRWHQGGAQPAGTYVAKLISADKTVQTLKFTKQ